MSCNVCIAPEEEGDSFRSIDSDDAIAEKIETVFKLKLSETAKICQRCEKEVETAYDVYNRIFDAKDYFEHLKSETDVAKVFFECFHCSEVFTELDKFEAHIESLPLMLSIEGKQKNQIS